MTPSQAIVRESARTFLATDANERRLLLRRLTALDTLRLFKAAGPVLAENQPWLSMAGLAFSVLELDGVPVPAPTTEAQIEGLIERLGDDGLAAIATSLESQLPVSGTRADVGNSRGTPS
jgi:hypothetical protein